MQYFRSVLIKIYSRDGVSVSVTVFNRTVISRWLKRRLFILTLVRVILPITILSFIKKMLSCDGGGKCFTQFVAFQYNWK